VHTYPNLVHFGLAGSPGLEEPLAAFPERTDHALGRGRQVAVAAQAQRELAVYPGKILRAN
jgi:hypothetical protein